MKKSEILFYSIFVTIVFLSACSQPAQQQTTSTTNKSQFVMPQTEEECLKQEGVWQKLGARPKEECNISTRDVGEPCTDSDQCEGACINNDPLSTSGKCSEWKVVIGCHIFVENNKLRPSVCID